MMATKVERISHMLYDNDISLDFLPNSHQYKVGKERVQNVSSILSVIGMDDRFTRWVVEKTTDLFRKIAPRGEILDEAHIDSIAREMMGESNRLRDEAAAIGTAVHNVLEQYIKQEIASHGTCNQVLGDGEFLVPSSTPNADKINKAVLSFFNWVQKHEIYWLASERILFSRTLMFAGTLDAVAFVDNVPTLIDFKASNHIYPKYFLQTAAYAFALLEERTHYRQKYSGRHDEIPDNLFKKIVEWSSLDRMILRLDKETGIIDPYHVGSESLIEDIRLFQTVLDLKRRLADMDKKISVIKKENKERGVDE